MANPPKTLPKSRFGEVLLEYGVITREQLKEALRRQAQVGGHIGSVLEEMGFLDEDSLLSFLSKQLNTSPINLFEIKVSTEVLNLLSFEKVKTFKVLPIKEAVSKITLAMVNPNDLNAIQDVEFALGRRIEPVITPCYQMDKAIAYFEKKGYGKKAFDGEKLKVREVTVGTAKIPDVFSLLKRVVEEKATDLYITAGVPPSLRIDNDIVRLSMPSITPKQTKELAFSILTKEQREVFEIDKELDFAITLPDAGRFRVNIYQQRNSVSFAARIIVDEIFSLEELLLPEWIADYALRTQGFILITGPSGHGKTTTLSTIVDIINSNRKANIVTLEDPIEYLHKHKKSNINQREIGIDTGSFAKGMKHIFRQNPDVIVIGEMRDPESIAIALTAAETGHMVISTMNSLNTTSAVDRIIDIFPANRQHQVRMQFADTFLFVLAQKLVPGKDGKGRVVACEKMISTYRIRNLLRDGKTQGIRSLMQVASDDLMSIDQSLAKLYRDRLITFETGLKYADNPTYYKQLAS